MRDATYGVIECTVPGPAGGSVPWFIAWAQTDDDCVPFCTAMFYSYREAREALTDMADTRCVTLRWFDGHQVTGRPA